MEAGKEDAPKLVTLSFLDSDSKLILNRIHDKLESLDQKMSFVTEFLLHKVAASSDDSEPPRKLPRPSSPFVKVNQTPPTLSLLLGPSSTIPTPSQLIVGRVT